MKKLQSLFTTSVLALVSMSLWGQVPTVDGDPCDIALYGAPLGQDNENDTPTNTADVENFWLLQDGDDIYVAWSRFATGSGTSSFNILLDADCDGGRDIIIELVWGAIGSNVTQAVDVEISDVNGNSLFLSGFQGPRVCGDNATAGRFAEYTFKLSDLVENLTVIDPCDCDCGELTITLAGSFAGGSFNSALKDGFDILSPTFSTDINECPVADFTKPPGAIAVVGNSVTFDASTTVDNAPDNESLSYAWDFGDLTTATGNPVTHTYLSTGTYTVMLTVTDIYGCEDVSLMDITIVAPPSIATTKDFTGFTVLPNGNFLVDFDFIVLNDGTTTLDNVQLVDDLETQFGCAFQGNVSLSGGTYMPAATAVVTPPMINAGYMGTAAAADMLDGFGSLAPGDTYSLNVSVEVDPDCAGAPTPLLNQSIATGTGPTGDMATDMSDDGTDPTTDNGEGGEDDPTPVPLPGLGVAKQVSTTVAPVESAISGNYFVTYEFFIQNTGNVVLDDISLVDDFATQFGAAFVQAVPPATVTSVAGSPTTGGGNVAYSGSGSGTELLDGAAILAPGEIIQVSIVVELDPDATDTGVLVNQATATGTDPDDIMVDDLSDSGTDPDGSNPGSPDDGTGPNEFDDPTSFPVLPAIGASKAVSAIADAATQGNFLVTFTFMVQNLGNITLSNLSLVDEFDVQFGASGFVGIAGPPVVTANTASSAPAANTSFDGLAAGMPDLLAGSLTDELRPGEKFSVEITVELDPSEATLPLLNQANATGTPVDNTGTPIGDPVEDLTDNGVDPVGENGDGSEDTPTPVELPGIGVAKRVSDSPVPFPDPTNPTNFIVTYDFVIENIGSVDLTSVSLTDDFSLQLGSTYLGFVANSIVVTNIDASVVPMANNATFNGDTDTEMLASPPGTLLAVGQSFTVSVQVIIDPNAFNAPPVLNNQALATGVTNAGEIVEDLSDDGVDTMTDNGSGGTDDPTPLPPLPRIGIAKSVDVGAPPSPLLNGNFAVNYLLVIENLGNTDLENILVEDDLMAQLGCAFVQILENPVVMDGNTVDLGGALPTANTAYAGNSTDDNITNNDGLLPVGASFVVKLEVEIDPDCSSSTSPLLNQASVNGTIPGTTTMVDDLSDNGVDPESDNDEGGFDNPTPLDISSIGLSKNLTSISPTATPNYLVDFQFIIQNTGNTTLTNVELEDDLVATFGAAFVPGTITFTAISGTATTPGATNPTYTGTGASSTGSITTVDLLDGTATLASGETLGLSISFEIDPLELPFEGGLENIAVTSGMDAENTTVTDQSEDGLVPDGSDNNGDGTEDTPTPMPEFVSVGGTVFEDANSSSVIDLGDILVENVSIDLLYDANMDGMITGGETTPIRTVLTDASGVYYFENLLPGNYQVVVSAGNFAPGNPLATAPVSSNDLATTPLDNNVDNDDNGTQIATSGATTSPIINLQVTEEPTDGDTENGLGNTVDNANDDNGNMTIDFGFLGTVGVGGVAWFDTDEDGLLGTTEQLIPNVTVTLFDAATNMPVTIDANGDPVTTMLTDLNGEFLFENLPLGSYYVNFDYSTIPNPEYYLFTTQNNAPQESGIDSDVNPANGDSDSVTPAPATIDDTLGAGLICNISVELDQNVTTCSTKPIALTDIGALIVPSSLGGIWQTSGDGTFDDSGEGVFGVAISYTVGAQDIQNGTVTLTLMTDEPPGPCEIISASITVAILKVDCGGFPWDGSQN